MSITAETAKQHANDPAVLCCRAEEGTVLDPSRFEDPAIFPDLVDSGLLNTDGALTLGQVLNGKTKLTKTCDSLTPLNADNCEGFDAAAAPAAEEVVEEAPAAVEAAPAPVAAAPVACAGGVIKLHIGEGKNIDIELPTGLGGGAVVAPVAEAAAAAPAAVAAAPVEEEKVVRELTRKHYKITEVKRGPETKIEGSVLYIREGIEAEAVESQDLVTSMKIEVITPDLYHTYSETVMDIQPIATKEDEWALGEGVTRVLDGAVTVVTGTTDEGIQIGEFGSS